MNLVVRKNKLEVAEIKFKKNMWVEKEAKIRF
jgi:hypothetical protein